VTTPGVKKVYRIINRANGKSEGDYITLADENPQEEEQIKMFHPIHTFVSKYVSNFEAKELLVNVFQDGKLVYDLPSLEKIKNDVKENLYHLWDEYKRTLNPEEYPVDLSQKCWDNKMNLIKKVKEEVKALSTK